MSRGADWIARERADALRDNGGREPWKELPKEHLDVFGAVVTGDDSPRKGCIKSLRWLTNNGFIREAVGGHRNGLPVLTPKGQRAAVGLGYNKVVLAAEESYEEP